MQGPLSLWILLAWAGVIAAPVQAYAADRELADRVAKARFLDTCFFEDGRGMHDYPGEILPAEKDLGIIPWNSQKGSNDLPAWLRPVSRFSMKEFSRKTGF